MYKVGAENDRELTVTEYVPSRLENPCHANEINSHVYGFVKC